ncbi:MAG: hypothetical protein IJT77_14860 [Clostridia bacterium]|nr:hypothetical protein [Clostridia bacterium]
MKYILRKVMFAVILLSGLLILFAANMNANIGKIVQDFRSRRIASVEDISAIVESVEDTINEGFIGRMGFVETYSQVARILGKKEISDFLYVKDENNYLHTVSFYTGFDPEMLTYAIRLKILQETVEEKGGKLLFIIPPIKYRVGNTTLDYGLPAANPENKISELMNVLTDNGISVIDFNQYFPNQNLPYDQSFYRTERYWTIPAAWMAAREIAHWMEEQAGVELDPDGSKIGPTAFDWVTYPGKMLGSQGLKTGKSYIGVEDFTALWPKDAGLYEYLCYLENGERNIIRGDIYDTLIDRNLVTSLGDTPQKSAYNSYLPGLYLHNIITNRNNFEGLRIFMIRDNYFSPVTVFLAPLCGIIDSIWSDLEETIYKMETYIKNQKFDFVIMEIDPYNISDDTFDFYREEAEIRIDLEGLRKEKKERTWDNLAF